MDRITDVRPGEGLTLHLRYRDQATVHVDVSGLLTEDLEMYAPLADRAFFVQVTVLPRGRGVSWPGGLTLAAATLRLRDDDPNKSPALYLLDRFPGVPLNPVSLMLREAVVASGLTQTEVAERAGILQPALARLIDPLYQRHTFASVRQVAQALGLELDIRLRPSGSE